MKVEVKERTNLLFLIQIIKQRLNDTESESKNDQVVIMIQNNNDMGNLI